MGSAIAISVMAFSFIVIGSIATKSVVGKGRANDDIICSLMRYLR